MEACFDAFSHELLGMFWNCLRKLEGLAFSPFEYSFCLGPEQTELFVLLAFFFSVRQTLMFSIPVSLASPIPEES